MNNSVSIKDLEFSYLDNAIFEGLSTYIESNSFVSIIGNNGSGKSTLLKVIAGILEYKGEVIIDNNIVTKENKYDIKKYIGFIDGDIDNYFVSDNVIVDLVFALENLGLSKEVIAEKLDNIISLFRLGDIKDKNISDLNKKEKIILAVSCSLIYNPRILLLDEVFGNLDRTSRTEIFKLLKDYKSKNNLTIIMVTHDMEDTLYSDKIIVMDNGKIVRYDSVINIYKDKCLVDRYNINIPFVIELSMLLKSHGIIEDIYTDIDKLMEEL